MRGLAGLKTRIARLERQVDVEWIGVAWLNPDKSIVFEGRVFTDEDAFEKAWHAKGYTIMYLVAVVENFLCGQEVRRCTDASGVDGVGNVSAEGGKQNGV
jgi:hypothetical protein